MRRVPPSASALASPLCPDSALRANWLNVLRLAFAVLVLFSHCYPLTGGSNRTEPLWRWSGQITLGDLAVNAFFLISGFLIVRSWLYSKSMGAYFRHRVLRIHPGFAVALLVSLVLATISCASPAQYLRALPWKEFIYSGFTLRYGVLDIPGTAFPGNPYGGVNASLWTIPIEFMAYIGVAVYGLFGLFKYRRLWLATFGAILAVYLAKIYRDGQADAWWRFACFFCVGATFYLFRDRLPRRRWIAALAVGLLVFGLFRAPWLNALGPLAGAWLLFYVAFLPIPAALERTFRTDLSYGVYLYAYPVQQTLVHIFSIHTPLGLFVAALPITLVLAWLSWTFVERRFLTLKNRDYADCDPAAPLAATSARSG